MQHKTIFAQGGTVHYWVARNENTSDCIVFTHGVTADHTMFEKQIPYFSDNYTILLWDVPMHGLSKPYQKFAYRDTAEILHSILQKESRYSYQKMLSMLKPLSKTEIIRQMQIAYEYFIVENKDVDFSLLGCKFPNSRKQFIIDRGNGNDRAYA